MRESQTNLVTVASILLNPQCAGTVNMIRAQKLICVSFQNTYMKQTTHIVVINSTNKGALTNAYRQ
jgi:hypothetical protein